MPIASRTPEGDPFACRVCGAVGLIEPSPVVGDAVCPRCGGYLAGLLVRLGNWLGVERFDLDTPLAELGVDSVDLLDAVLELAPPTAPIDTDALACVTVEDLIRYLARLRDDAPGS